MSPKSNNVSLQQKHRGQSETDQREDREEEEAMLTKKARLE